MKKKINKKLKLRKALSLGLVSSMALSPVSVLANSVNVTETQQVSTDSSAETNLTINGIESSFRLIVPKLIKGTGSSGTLTYDVTLEGDMAGNQEVFAVPDETVTLSQDKKSDVIADITQDKVSWKADEVDIKGNGEITYSGLTSGTWQGIFNFNVGIRNSENSELPDNPIELTPGLYGADGNLLAPLTAEQVEADAELQEDYIINLTSSLGINEGDVYKVVIPEGTTRIGSYAFVSCYNLTSITFPDSVTSIGEEAFRNCTSLTSIIIPNNVTSIGKYAFRGCTSLTSILIPNSVTSIGEEAFEGCTSLKSVTIPDSVTKISGVVFRGCTSLESVTIPDSVTKIDYWAFRDCTSLTSINILDSVTWIGTGAFRDCTSLESVTIPDSVTSIGANAFYKVPHIYYNGTATGSPWGALSIN